MKIFSKKKIAVVYSKAETRLKVALVYDRVNKWGGAERVLLALHEIFPDAPLYTSVYDPKCAPWAKVFPKVHASFLQKIPFIKSLHELFGWLMPIAFESFSFDDYDLVISVTSEAAKGIITNKQTLHICYCLTPTRYLWSSHNYYFKNPPVYFKIFPFFWTISRPFVAYLKSWEMKAAKRPDKIIAISTEVRNRIKKYYNRDAEIIFPPVEMHNVKHKFNGNRSYYLIVNRLVPYKKVDLAVSSFNKLRLPLIVVGTGSEKNKLARIAKHNVRFVGQVSENELIRYYQGAKALVMPQEEDFGIVAVEAQSFGVPVIAYKKGGALDTVIEGKTGIFFKKQTVKSLMQAVKKFDKMSFSERILKVNAKRFSKEVFKKQLQRSLIRSYFGWRRRNSPLAKI
jgi:glycosyltransferase involved in cell wall biosynthesis